MALKNGRQSSDLQTILLGSVIPTGTISPFAGGAVPAGWLLCDGSTVSRSTYSALFDKISTFHGAGDGSTTFHLPDYRGRFLRGADNMGTGAAGRDPNASTRTAANSGGNTTRSKLESVFLEGFESGNFTQNGWTVVNGTQTNKFIVGTSTKRSGSYSAYISNNSTNNMYTNTSASVVWFYKDITLDNGQFDLSFYYRQVGETSFDRGRIIIDPTLSVVPVAGTNITTTPAGGVNEVLTSESVSWVNYKRSLDSYKQSTIRIIFGWFNDSLVGTNPPIAIDDIEIYKVTDVGSVQADALQNITGDLIVGSSSPTSQTGAFVGTSSGSPDPQGTGRARANISFDASRVARTSTESRPQNAACLYIIKA
jgi:hypothetical protein